MGDISRFGDAILKSEGDKIKGTPTSRVPSYWPGKTLDIRLHGLLEEIDWHIRAGLYWEIASDGAVELAQLIRDLMDRG